MSKLSFKNLCAVFMAVAFTFFLAGSPSEARSQSPDKIEKANSISNWLIVGALAITLVVVIVTVSKGDKKGKDEGEKKDAEAQEMRQNLGNQVRLGSSSSDIKASASSEYEAGEVMDGRPENGTASPVQNAILQQHGCMKFDE